MANVTSDIDAKIASYSAGVGVERLGGAEQFPARSDDVRSFPDHAVDWTGGSVFNESWEEWFFR